MAAQPRASSQPGAARSRAALGARPLTRKTDDQEADLARVRRQPAASGEAGQQRRDGVRGVALGGRGSVGGGGIDHPCPNELDGVGHRRSRLDLLDQRSEWRQLRCSDHPVAAEYGLTQSHTTCSVAIQQLIQVAPPSTRASVRASGGGLYSGIQPEPHRRVVTAGAAEMLSSASAHACVQVQRGSTARLAIHAQTHPGCDADAVGSGRRDATLEFIGQALRVDP